MLATFACVLAILSLAAVYTAIKMCLHLTEQVRTLNGELKGLRTQLSEGLTPPAQALPSPSPLEGMRVGIQVAQDHEHPTFAKFLCERLIAEDAEPSFFGPDQPVWQNPDEGPDLIVKGSLTCNGYAELFYSADLACVSRRGTITTLTEKPAEGGRQLNLATELVEKLKSEMTQAVARSERRRALEELKG